MAERLFRVTGVANFHLPPGVPDEDVARGVIDLREWKRRYDNDAELGTAYKVDTDPGEARGETLDFHLHVNDVKASGVAAAVTWALIALRERLAEIGRSMDDAVFVDVDATRQRRPVKEPRRV